MKKYLSELMALCPGRINVEIDRHHLFGESATDVIERSDRQFSETKSAVVDVMKSDNTIIHLEAATTTKPMPVVDIYHYDLELAIKEVLKQIKKWKPAKK
jgi:hypothetical protein